MASHQTEAVTVWITGASTGIGHALAIKYAKAGHTVLASARTADKLEALSRTPDTDNRIIPCPLDVTDQVAIAAFVEQQITKHQLPDLVILNAGYYEPVGIEAFTVEHVERINDVNFLGVVRCLCALLPSFKKRASGHIAITASVAGYAGLPRAAAYGATKAALINMTESLKPELNELGIDITVINPGFVETPMTDKNQFEMPFIVSPEQAAERVYSGLQSRHFEITFPKRFTWLMKLVGILPYSLFFSVTRRLVKSEKS